MNRYNVNKYLDLAKQALQRESQTRPSEKKEVIEHKPENLEPAKAFTFNLTEDSLQVLNAEGHVVIEMRVVKHQWERPQDNRCPCCKGSIFWWSVHGVRVCATCHPPAAPWLVAKWEGQEESSNSSRLIPK